MRSIFPLLLWNFHFHFAVEFSLIPHFYIACINHRFLVCRNGVCHRLTCHRFIIPWQQPNFFQSSLFLRCYKASSLIIIDRPFQSEKDPGLLVSSTLCKSSLLH